MFGLSFVASALLLASGVAAQANCASLQGAIASYAQETENDGLDKSITTFSALLDVFGVDAQVISQFGSSNVLVPTDQAFVNLISELGGPDVEPLDFVMTHPNTFKQIILYHFTGPMKGTSGEAHTALAAMERLPSFIDVSAICGREDARFIKIQYMAEDGDGQFSLTEPVAKHFTAEAVDTVCDTDAVTVTTIDTVLTPCPHNMHFPANLEGEFGCMSVAMAASMLGSHPFGSLPFEDSASPVVANLKHPNLLASSGDQFTVFVPTAEALDAAGVTSADFLALPGALDHVVNGHVAQREVCIGGQIPATPVDTLADDQFCESEGALTMVATAPDTIQVVSATGDQGTTTAINNIAVCGGLMHVVDSVLLPCNVEDYSPAAPEVPTPPVDQGATQTERGAEQPTTTEQPASTTTTPNGAAAAAAGTTAAVLAACALLL